MVRFKRVDTLLTSSPLPKRSWRATLFMKAEVMMDKYDKKEQIKDAIGLFLMVPVAYVLVVLAFSL